MRAIQISKTGGPEVLEVVEIPAPVAGAGQVLVRVEASGVNFIDTYLREGRYPAPLPFPLLHVDTTWKFQEMIKFRDETVRHLQVDLITHVNRDGLAHFAVNIQCITAHTYAVFKREC